MTSENFKENWIKSFPDSLPISYLFKDRYPDRWLRIHSLPDSKRYAENDSELNDILERQNKVATELFGSGTTVLLVAGEYNWGAPRSSHTTDEDECFKRYSFSLLDNIDMYKIDPEKYDEIDIYRPAFAETKWGFHEHDTLLSEIAKDNNRAFFVSFTKQTIFAPYDGGVDLVLKDSAERDHYKEKYKEWLSKRADGL